MSPLKHQLRGILAGAAFATCFVPATILAQGSFVPSAHTGTPQATSGTDLTRPPVPFGAVFPKKAQTVAPSEVDYEVIGPKVQPVSSAAEVTNDGAFEENSLVEKLSSKQPVAGSTPRTYEVPKNRTASTPIVTIEIQSPSEVNLKEETNVTLRLRNAGSEKVKEITLAVELPPHAKFVSAVPTPSSQENGTLGYTFSDLAANKEREITIRVVPTEKLPLDFVTKMQVIEMQKTVVAVHQPKLLMTVKGPSQTNIGDETTHVVSIENVGDGVARKVRLQGNFPDELRFLKQKGMNAPKDLKPGENLVVMIQSLAKLPGQVKLDFTAEGDGVVAHDAHAPLKISQPELKLLAVGPNMNFVDRDGIYSIKVDNSGEVNVSDVSVALAIPQGMKVTTINRQAKMDEVAQTLTWTFDSIEARTSETIQLRAISSKLGEQVCRISVASNETRKSEFTLKTAIAARADLSIDMANNSGPVQVGSKASFDVNVVNKGSQSASDVEVTIELPPSLMVVAKDNPDLVVDEGSNSITFLSNQVKPGKQLSFNFTALGVAKGEHIVRSALTAGGSERRIIVEESVYVYETNESRISENLTPVFPR